MHVGIVKGGSTKWADTASSKYKARTRVNPLAAALLIATSRLVFPEKVAAAEVAGVTMPSKMPRNPSVRPAGLIAQADSSYFGAKSVDRLITPGEAAMIRSGAVLAIAGILTFMGHRIRKYKFRSLEDRFTYSQERVKYLSDITRGGKDNLDLKVGRGVVDSAVSFLFRARNQSFAPSKDCDNPGLRRFSGFVRISPMNVEMGPEGATEKVFKIELSKSSRFESTQTLWIRNDGVTLLATAKNEGVSHFAVQYRHSQSSTYDFAPYLENYIWKLFAKLSMDTRRINRSVASSNVIGFNFF